MFWDPGEEGVGVRRNLQLAGKLNIFLSFWLFKKVGLLNVLIHEKRKVGICVTIFIQFFRFVRCRWRERFDRRSPTAELFRQTLFIDNNSRCLTLKIFLFTKKIIANIKQQRLLYDRLRSFYLPLNSIHFEISMLDLNVHEHFLKFFTLVQIIRTKWILF